LRSKGAFALFAGLVLFASGISQAADRTGPPVPLQVAGRADATEKTARLDALFSRLSRAGDQNSASQFEQRIWSEWLIYDDAEIDRQMSIARSAMSNGQPQAALDILDTIVEQAPEYAEGWNKRATVLYMVGRHDESLQDIDRVLALEPRHFGAISGIALIMLAKGDNDAVIAAVKRALRIHPFLPGAADLLRRAGGADAGKPI
jgi:tetratricopeptide (TPR) repeat protein